MHSPHGVACVPLLPCFLHKVISLIFKQLEISPEILLKKKKKVPTAYEYCCTSDAASSFICTQNIHISSQSQFAYKEDTRPQILSNSIKITELCAESGFKPCLFDSRIGAFTLHKHLS